MTIEDNHNQWQKSDWEPSQSDSIRPLASRNAKNQPYRPAIKYSYSVATSTREEKLSEAALAALPEERRGEVERALKLQRGADYEGSPAPLPLHLAKKATDQNLNSAFVKNANAASLGGGGPHLAGTGSTTHLMPNLYSPLFLTANLQLPRDRITGNAWNRAFYQTNPIVRNAINMHATYPISKLNIKCRNKAIERKYLEMIKKTDLFSVVQKISLEYWMLGEVFPYATFDQDTKMWKRIYCHNPDYIVIRKDSVDGEFNISLKPDPKLQEIVQSTDPAKRKYRDKLDPALLDAVAKNQYIPLDNFNISHIKNENHDYDAHGSSIIMSVWKDLVLWDLFRENKFIQADAMVNPLTLIKVGASGPEGHYPRQEELQSYREIFEQAQYDKDFKVFTHPDVAVERVGFNSAVMDISSDMNFILDNIFIGLMVPKSIIQQEGASYSSASVGLDVIKQRYDNFRNKIANWLMNKIFAPMAEANGWYETIEEEKHLILPVIEWNQMTLYDNDQYITHLMALLDKPAPTATAGVSRSTIYRSLGLDFEDELSNQKREAIKMAIHDKEMFEIKSMSLSELRAIDPEQPIQESKKSATALPGQIPDDAMNALPPATPDAGMPI